MKPVTVAPDRWNFVHVGTTQYVTPIGGNMLNDEHPGQGTLFQHFDRADVERRFARMAELGLNCLRQAIGTNEVFDYDRGQLKPDGMKNWDAFIALAEKYGVYLMPVGGYPRKNDWFDVELLADSGKTLDESCDFWSKFCGHYRGHPAIWAWDLRNELLYWNRPHMTTPGSPDEARVDAMLKADWPRWLAIRYGSVAAMNRAYSSNHDSFDQVPGKVAFEENPFHPRPFDFKCYLNDRGYDWCKKQCDVIRSVAPGHMICSGNNTWLSPDQDLFLANGFHNVWIHDLFDFVTHHPYPACQAVPNGRGDPLDGGEPLRYWLNACVAMSRFDHYGKPVVIQEFGWYGGGESAFLCPLPYRSEQQHADYTRTLIDALLPHANGFINWPLMDMPKANDISNHGGIFTHDGRHKALAKVYADLVKKTQGQRLVRTPATATLTYSLLGLYTSRKHLDRFFDEADQTLRAGAVPDFRFI